MGADAPQWLSTSFVDTMREIGATAPADRLQAEASDLISRWSEKTRRLHNIRHLINILAHIDELATTAHDPDILRVAAWYHGAALNRCMAVRLKDADPLALAAACVDITRTHLAALGVSEDVINRVSELLLFLARHRAPRTDLDAQVLVDADLASLAIAPQEYKKLRENLRAELADVSDVDYLTARCATVKRLLSFDTIYQSPLGEAWESAARANLEFELTKLESALAACGASADADDTSEADLPDSVTDEDVTSTGTIVIKRRQLKRNVCEDRDEEVASTGVLPTLAPAEDSAATAASDEDSASSLEMAIEALDLPSTPAK